MNETGSSFDKELIDLASQTTELMDFLKVINDLIDFMPEPDCGEVREDPLFYYSLIYRAMGNVHSANQSLINKIDNIACKIYDKADVEKEVAEMKKSSAILDYDIEKLNTYIEMEM